MNTIALTKALTLTGMVVVLLVLTIVPAGALVFFQTDFSGGAPPEFSGVTTTQSVQGYAGIGTGSNVFANNFLANASTGNPASPTILTLTGLPAHTSIDLNFLLAIMDSWDGIYSWGPDYFNISVDGNSIFSHTFYAWDYSPDYTPPPGVLLTSTDFDEYLAGNPDWPDQAYNLGLDPLFDHILHTSNTLEIRWWASGGGFQGGDDESWAIDNVKVILNQPSGNPIPEPCTVLLVGSGIVGLAGLRRKFNG